MNSLLAPIAVSGDPVIARAIGKKVSPLINSLLFIDDMFILVYLKAISCNFQRKATGRASIKVKA